MISIQKRFLFIHVPKTGGNSLQAVLRYYSEDDVVVRGSHQDGIERFEIRNKHFAVTKHATAADYQRVLPSEVYGSMFRFAILRNPWDRMISLYFSPHQGPVKWNRFKFLSLLYRTPPLRHFIHTRAPGDSGSGLSHDINYLLRFEHLDEDFKTLCGMLDIPHTPLRRLNRSGHLHYSKYYDPVLREIVRRKFSEEIELGHYCFEKA